MVCLGAVGVLLTWVVLQVSTSVGPSVPSGCPVDHMVVV